MKTCLIEREIPGASQLTHEQLCGITSTSNDAVASLHEPYVWLHSSVAGDKVYCLHQAEDVEVIKDHARAGAFPANLIVEVASVSTAPDRGTSRARALTRSEVHLALHEVTTNP